MDSGHCTECGAPWRSDVTGLCRWCRGPGRPPGAGPAPAAGELDPAVLCAALVQCTVDGNRPLDGLAGVLMAGLGPQAVRPTENGGRVVRLWVGLGGLTYDAALTPAGVVVDFVHAVRGVVLKRERLDLGGFAAELALQLAPMAARAPQLRSALLELAG